MFKFLWIELAVFALLLTAFASQSSEPVLHVIGMAPDFDNICMYDFQEDEVLLTVEFLQTGCDQQVAAKQIQSVYWKFYALNTSNK